MRILLVDESEKPQVRLAIEGGGSLLRYRLGSVTISKSK